jgi:uracil-DNA glycosylase
VVILGQDPYHGPGQARAVFSVRDGIAFPPSLRNIFKEIENDLGIPVPQSGDLTRWASQGVLLLNATLTVRANLAGSHQKKGWETFTDEVIKLISEQKSMWFLFYGEHMPNKR